MSQRFRRLERQYREAVESLSVSYDKRIKNLASVRKDDLCARPNARCAVLTLDCEALRCRVFRHFLMHAILIILILGSDQDGEENPS